MCSMMRFRVALQDRLDTTNYQVRDEPAESDHVDEKGDQMEEVMCIHFICQMLEYRDQVSIVLLDQGINAAFMTPR